MYYDYSASFISYHSTLGAKIKDKEGKSKLHTLAAKALDMYRRRWQIKTMFKGLEPTFPHQHITRLCFLVPGHPWHSRDPFAS